MNLARRLYGRGAGYDSSAAVIWASPGCVKQDGASIYTCSVGTLANGASAEFKLVLRKDSAGSVYASSRVDSSTNDWDSSNNTSIVSIAINASAAGVPVWRYRLYNQTAGAHHYTTDLNEYNALGANPSVWVQEGTMGKVLNNPGAFNGVAVVPYYRLYSNCSLWHHWTTDANEYYTLAQQPCWNGEGVDGYLLPVGTTGAT